MPPRTDNLIVVLDIGSAWTRVLAADVNEGVARYRGHGIVESAGMRKGLIAELGPASRAVRSACEQAERTARLNIVQCAVGVGGPNVRGLNTNGGFNLGNRMREITRDDVRSAVDRARAIALPPDREILHLLPRQFILDEQPGIFDPVGMVGARLEVDLHIATCAGSTMQSSVTCANRAGLEVSEVILESVGAAESTLSADERELGVCLLDIGAHSSDLVVFFEGAVAHTSSVPIGGAHFTNDLAIGLQMPVTQAEEIKRQYGNAVVTSVPQLAEVEIANPEPLPGMLDVTETQLRVPARTGVPVRLSHMPGELVHPGFASAIGMLLYVQRTRAMRAAEDHSLKAKLRAIFAASY
jgi:cell division protein FtsA